MEKKELLFLIDDRIQKIRQIATDYNILENNCFENDTTDWVSGTYSSDAYFSGTRALKLSGDVSGYCESLQTVKCKTEKNVRETFTLSGWAKADEFYAIFCKIYLTEPQDIV